jgi:hypothetical protein
MNQKNSPPALPEAEKMARKGMDQPTPFLGKHCDMDSSSAARKIQSPGDSERME